MRQNRVRELRLARAWSVRELAKRADLDHSYVVRIEKAKRGLSVDVAERLAKALETSVSNVLGIDSVSGAHGTNGAGGFAEDAEPYEMTAADPVAVPAKSRDNVRPYLIKSGALSALGMQAGTVVFVDISQAAVDALKPLDCVVVQHYSEMSATTLVRQFVPPGLLITNSSGPNGAALRIDGDDVAIKGVIVGSFQGRT